MTLVGFFARLLQKGFKLEADPEVAELLGYVEAELYQDAYQPAYQALQAQRSRRKEQEESRRKAKDVQAMQKLDAFTEK